MEEKPLTLPIQLSRAFSSCQSSGSLGGKKETGLSPRPGKGGNRGDLLGTSRSMAWGTRIAQERVAWRGEHIHHPASFSMVYCPKNN